MSSSFVLPFPSRPRPVTTPSRVPRPLSAKVSLVVRDLDRAVGFWCGALGLELRLRIGDSWAEVVSRGFVVGLLRDAESSAPPSAPATRSPATPTITIEVDDLESALDTVRARGGQIDELDGAGDWAAGEIRYLRDPDGHRVALCELHLGPTVVPEWYGS